MIVNGITLLKAAPIKNMIGTKETNGMVSHGMSEAGYDIRIKQAIRFDGETVWVNGKAQDKGRFVLASAIEEFQMPTDLIGIVHDKSSWARKGVSVFNTVIENGWSGFLTLEIVFHGEPVTIPAGSGIAQVVFHKTTNSAKYNGKYQDQPDRPVKAINQ